jgi:multidrug efflux system outer membrane protein
LRYAEAEKKGLIATYEKTIQSAFKDVADALARRQTLDEQLDAQREYVAAEGKRWISPVASIRPEPGIICRC